MKLQILTVLIGFFLVFGFSALAQTSNTTLPTPGLLPDHPLVIFQDIFERLQLVFAFSPEAKARLHLQLAEKRLAELNLALIQNKTNLVPTLSEKFEKELNDTEDEVNSTTSSGKNVTELAEHVAEETFKHKLVLERVLAKAPEQAKDSIEHAIEASMHGYENAVENILEHGNVTGTVNITITIGNQTFTQTFNITSKENKTHVEKESEHNETCEGEDCNKPIIIKPVEKPEKGHEEKEESEITTTSSTTTTILSNQTSANTASTSNSSTTTTTTVPTTTTTKEGKGNKNTNASKEDND